MDDSQGHVRAAAGACAHAAVGGVAPSGDNSPHATIPPLGWHEVGGLTPLMFLIVLIGVYPRPFLDQMRPAVMRIEENVQAQQGEATAPPRVAPTDRPPRRARAMTRGLGGFAGRSVALRERAAPKRVPSTAKPKQPRQSGQSSPDPQIEENRP